MSFWGRSVFFSMLAVAVLFPMGWGHTQELRDPMRPPARLTAPKVETEPGSIEAPALRLHSTHIGEGRRSAIINGIPLETGDSIAGARVVRIDLGQVWLLTDRGERLALRLAPVEMTRPVD